MMAVGRLFFVLVFLQVSLPVFHPSSRASASAFIVPHVPPSSPLTSAATTATKRFEFPEYFRCSFLSSQQTVLRLTESLSSSNEDESQLSSIPAQDNNAADANLVNQAAFISAVEALHQASTSAAADDGKDEQRMYAIGKLEANLCISDGPPGINLSESEPSSTNIEKLVLVTEATGRAAEVGIEVGDTIVSVGVKLKEDQGKEGGQVARKNTNAATLEELAQVLMTASTYALSKGDTEIVLELNRLVRLVPITDSADTGGGES